MKAYELMNKLAEINAGNDISINICLYLFELKSGEQIDNESYSLNLKIREIDQREPLFSRNYKRRFKMYSDVITDELIQKNKALIERYPFLLPRNRFTGKVVADYDYSFTELDDMPDGWRKAFGEQMCEELREALIIAERLDEYRISDIKEKFGFLHWYDFGNTQEGYDVISKYEKLSKRICISCGKPATKISTGWISPYCDDCADKISSYENFVDIDEFYNEFLEE